MKYQGSRTQCSKVINKVKVFKKKNGKLQGHRVKNNDTHQKILSQRYQSSSTHCSKAIGKVMGHIPSSRSQGTHGKVLLQGILV